MTKPGLGTPPQKGKRQKAGVGSWPDACFRLWCKNEKSVHIPVGVIVVLRGELGIVFFAAGELTQIVQHTGDGADQRGDQSGPVLIETAGGKGGNI